VIVEKECLNQFRFMFFCLLTELGANAAAPTITEARTASFILSVEFEERKMSCESDPSNEKDKILLTQSRLICSRCAVYLLFWSPDSEMWINMDYLLPYKWSV